jgi:REP element-mobilizing transposase RayT
MNRGNRRQTVFEQDRDYELFLRKLAEFAAVCDVSLRTYCLMPNHFHLYLVTRQANLSAFMQALLTAFTVSKNRREGQSGHLFQGRFKAMVLEAESYEAVVSRYIALNPVRTEGSAWGGERLGSHLLFDMKEARGMVGGKSAWPGGGLWLSGWRGDAGAVDHGQGTAGRVCRCGVPCDEPRQPAADRFRAGSGL